MNTTTTTTTTTLTHTRKHYVFEGAGEKLSSGHNENKQGRPLLASVDATCCPLDATRHSTAAAGGHVSLQCFRDVKRSRSDENEVCRVETDVVEKKKIYK